jgi:hypothetical protein
LKEPRVLDTPVRSVHAGRPATHDVLTGRRLGELDPSGPHFLEVKWDNFAFRPGIRRPRRPRRFRAVIRESPPASVRQLADCGKETERAQVGLLARLPRDGREITPVVAAQLSGWPKPLAAQALEELVDAQLRYSPTPGSYAYHGPAGLF